LVCRCSDRLTWVSVSVSRLSEWYRSDLGRKQVRYFMASVVATLVSFAVYVVSYGPLRLGSAVQCNILSTAVGAVPSYFLNRSWAWGKSGRSHFLKEIVPFWALAFVGLGASLVSVNWAEHQAKAAHLSHAMVTFATSMAMLGAFVVVWIGKFIVFEKLVFIDHTHRRSR